MSPPDDETRPTALVTGASRGIGRATVEAFIERGWRVAAGVRDAERASEVAGMPEVELVHLDLSDESTIPDGVRAAQEYAGGALAAVVSNAAWALAGAVEDVDLDAAREQFQVNFFGGVAVLQAALPAMREARAGSIVFVSSIGARVTHPLLGMYGASKYALRSVAEALALEVRPFGIRVTMVEPGMVATEFAASTTATGSIGDGDGPYSSLFGELRSGFREWRRLHEVSAELVAEAVVRAASEPETPLAVLVGDDAAWLAHERETRDDAGFYGELLDFLGIQEHR